MRERWPEVIERDPYYNPNLSQGAGRFFVRQLNAC